MATNWQEIWARANDKLKYEKASGFGSPRLDIIKRNYLSPIKQGWNNLWGIPQDKVNPANQVKSIGEIRVEAPRIIPPGIVPQIVPPVPPVAQQQTAPVKVQAPVQTQTPENKTQQTTPKKESTQKVDNKPKVGPKSEKATNTKKPTTSTQKSAPESKLKPQPQTSGRSPEEVLKIQKELKAAGFDLGKFGANKDGLDSKWGQATQKAYDAYRLKQMQESTRVKTEDDYMKEAANARSAYQGIQTPMQSIPASSWRRTPNTLWMKNGGKFINELIQEFKKGGKPKIHIKPENKGKFNATKKKTGKSTEELTHSKNPVTKKRAIFAQNAAKWDKGGKKKNQKGGTIDWDLSEILKIWTN